VAAEAKLGELVFAHDYAFLHGPDGTVYSDRGDWAWHRYLDVAERLTVTSRARELPPDAALQGLTPMDQAGVSYAPIPSVSGPLLRYTNRREAVRRLRSALERADGLIARLPSEIGSLAVDVAHRLGKPALVEVVTCTWDALWNYGTWQGKVYAPISWWKTRRQVGRADFAVYETESFLQGRYPSSGRTVQCPSVELPEMDNTVLDRRLGRIEGWRPPFVIGLIGALSVGFKGIDTAVEALSRERERLPAFELRVLGSGEPARWQRLAAEAGVGGQVRFDGVLPSGESVNNWLDDVDLYIQPSFQEGLPRATLEAMSRACPALGSTAGGLPELLPPDCLHRPGDAERLGTLILRGVDREWRAAQAGRNFEVARRYTRPVLDGIRKEFFQEFARSARA
jgi:glycosyltransferase involved in cell wall biosynthesis